MPSQKDAMLTSDKVAERLGIDITTVALWIRKGYIKAAKTNPLAQKSPFLIPESEVERIEAMRRKSIERK